MPSKVGGLKEQFMNGSMEDYLNTITPHLHPDLISPAARSQIQSLAQALPSFSYAGFECRLGANQSRVDLQVNLPCLVLDLPQKFLINPTWQFFQRFCQEWTSPSSLLHQTIRNIVLEFDVAEVDLNEPRSLIPVPCVFLSLRPYVYHPERLMQLVQKLSDNSISPSLESNLRHCAAMLPENASICHLGAMLSRGVSGVRVNVYGMTMEQLPNYLQHIGWNDSSPALSRLVSALPHYTDFVVLSFDVSDRIRPRIGLECFFDQKQQAESRWPLLLDWLVAEGLCTPAKRDALLVWEGFSQKSATPDLWPSNIDWGDRFLGARAVSLFWRRLNHIKLVYQPGCPLEAKAYLAFGHGWFDPNILTQTPQPELKRRVPA
jgi:hypothetical protein